MMSRHVPRTTPANRHSLSRLVALVALFLATWLPASAAPTAPGVPPVQPFVGFSAPHDGGAFATDAASCSARKCVYLPFVQLPPTWVATQRREVSRSFYFEQYLPSEGVAAGWTGNHATCNPGATSPEFRNAVLARINYFRAMAGVPALLGLSDVYNGRAQAAALMMSVNQQLSHSPPASWRCYTAEGAQGAGSSDLYLGVYGPAAISGYIMDPGGGNDFVGHRRWILFPPTRMMGTGDIPPTSSYLSSNALWVFDVFGPRPPTRDGFVAWPPPGYAPYQVVFGRWSFSFPDADFSRAAVTMSSGGRAIEVGLAPVRNGYGENTLVWMPAGAGEGSWQRPSQDTTYALTISNVLVGGVARQFTYQVTVFDPANE